LVIGEVGERWLLLHSKLISTFFCRKGYAKEEIKGSIDPLKNFKGLRGINPFQVHQVKKLKLFLSPQ
jgi:hypothetical protein